MARHQSHKAFQQVSLAIDREQVSDTGDEWHFSPEHILVYFGYVVAVGLVIVFGLDLATGIPFQRATPAFATANVICGLILGYLSWNTHRDLV